jgi:hypothetical protein
MYISNPLDSFRSIKYKHGTQPEVSSNGILILSFKSSPKYVLRKSSIVKVLTSSLQRCSYKVHNYNLMEFSASSMIKNVLTKSAITI